MPLKWASVNQSRLGDWLAKVREAQPVDWLPPSYRLEKGSQRERLLKWSHGYLRQAKLLIREESGTAEIEFAPGFDERDALRLALGAAKSIDPERDFIRIETEDTVHEPQSVAVVDELWSVLNGLRPIGPGGRCILYAPDHQPGSIVRAEICVRARSFAIETKWRDPEQILTAVRRVLTDSGRAARLRAAFGYFEKSKFEPQMWLRPAFAFVIESPSSTTPRYRRGFVEAATESEELDLSDGLEGWSL